MAEDESVTAGDGDEPTAKELERRWDAVDDDPDLEEDLGYDLKQLDVLVTSNSDKKLMMLPRSEEWIREDAYLIADFEMGCDPIEEA